jgi:hypothetical protein
MMQIGLVLVVFWVGLDCLWIWTDVFWRVLGCDLYGLAANLRECTRIVLGVRGTERGKIMLRSFFVGMKRTKR